MPSPSNNGLKQAVRDRVWKLMQERGVARFPGAPGRIPNFAGAEGAARLLADQDEWRRARTLKCNPDAPQLPVRAAALDHGKRVYVAVPSLLDPKPFIVLDPAKLGTSTLSAASIRGAASSGRAVLPSRVRHIDLVVCGTVAVNRRGVRIGKGGGFSDLEFALLTETGAIDDRTVIATTVHPLQILDEDLPETAHDFRVDLIVTPQDVIRTPRRRRPNGVDWRELDEAKIAAIPALRTARPH